MNLSFQFGRWWVSIGSLSVEPGLGGAGDNYGLNDIRQVKPFAQGHRIFPG